LNGSPFRGRDITVKTKRVNQPRFMRGGKGKGTGKGKGKGKGGYRGRAKGYQPDKAMDTEAMDTVLRARRNDGWKHTNEAAPRHRVLDEKAQRARVLIVGDIHGCCDEFRLLLARYHQPGDTIILAGDLVNKGPKSAEVVRLARKLKCHAVHGNHEWASLRARKNRDGGKHAQKETFYSWTDELTEDDVSYIKDFPYTLHLPLHNAIVVHAGLVPRVELEAQDRYNMVHMRNLSVKPGGGGYEAQEKTIDGSIPWASCWDGVLKVKTSGGGTKTIEGQHVYFGHDARRKLQQYPLATGLDTGCLYGNCLTATILELGKPPRLVQVDAAHAYAKIGGANAKPKPDPLQAVTSSARARAVGMSLLGAVIAGCILRRCALA
jgi:hypothetical protein